MESLISYAAITFLALFPVANPIGVVPTFYSLTVDSSPIRRIRQARKIAVNVIIILAIFLISGRLILNFFGLSMGVLQVAGGLLLAHTAWGIVTTSAPQITLANNNRSPEGGNDITLIPMAVPIISGPGAIGMVMGLIAKDPQPANYLGSLLGIVGIGVIVYFCLVAGQPLLKLLGKNGIDGFTRIFGFFILAFAIQLMTDGIFSILAESPISLLVT